MMRVICDVTIALTVHEDFIDLYSLPGMQKRNVSKERRSTKQGVAGRRPGRVKNTRKKTRICDVKVSYGQR